MRIDASLAPPEIPGKINSFANQQSDECGEDSKDIFGLVLNVTSADTILSLTSWNDSCTTGLPVGLP